MMLANMKMIICNLFKHTFMILVSIVESLSMQVQVVAASNKEKTPLVGA